MSDKAVKFKKSFFDDFRYNYESFTDAGFQAIFSDITALNTSGLIPEVDGATANDFPKLILDVATGKYKLADSGFNSDSFAPFVHKHSQYLANNAANTFPSKTYAFLFDNDATHSPFTVTDNTVIVVNLNADLLDGSHASDFALKNHSHANYVRNDIDSNFPSATRTLTFNNDPTHKPFAVTDGTIMVDNLNAQYLNGIPSTGFSLKNHTHTNYLPNNADAGYDSVGHVFTFINDATHAAFAVSSHTIVVTNLNSDYLRGKTDADFFPATGNFDTRYIRMDTNITYDSTLHQITFGIDNCLPFSLDIVGAPMPVMTDFNAGKLNGKTDADFAPVVHDHDTRYPQLVNPSVTNNFVAFNNTTGALKDSGKSTADFFPAAGNFDTRYFTKANLTDYSTSLGLSQVSTIESNVYFMVGSDGVFHAGAAGTDGYMVIRINGVSKKFMTTA